MTANASSPGEERRDDRDDPGNRLATRLSVMLVDDHPVVVRGLRSICATDPRIEVVAEAHTEPEAIELVRRKKPDIVVLPIRLGGTRGGIELCRSIKSLRSSRVVVFTSFTRAVDAHVATLAGADAVVSKSASDQQLIQALHAAFTGRPTVILTPRQGESQNPQPGILPFEPLTGREQEILELVVGGLTNTAISRQLMIEMSTVKTHMRSILRKLGVGTRRDLL